MLSHAVSPLIGQPMGCFSFSLTKALSQKGMKVTGKGGEVRPRSKSRTIGFGTVRALHVFPHLGGPMRSKRFCAEGDSDEVVQLTGGVYMCGLLCCALRLQQVMCQLFLVEFKRVLTQTFPARQCHKDTKR